MVSYWLAGLDVRGGLECRLAVGSALDPRRSDLFTSVDVRHAFAACDCHLVEEPLEALNTTTY